MSRTRVICPSKCFGVVGYLPVLLLLLNSQCALVSAGCRQQVEKCGPVCVVNAETGKLDCNLRAVLILPDTSNVEASLSKVNSVINNDIKDFFNSF